MERYTTYFGLLFSLSSRYDAFNITGYREDTSLEQKKEKRKEKSYFVPVEIASSVT